MLKWHLTHIVLFSFLCQMKTFLQVKTYYSHLHFRAGGDKEAEARTPNHWWPCSSSTTYYVYFLALYHKKLSSWATGLHLSQALWRVLNDSISLLVWLLRAQTKRWPTSGKWMNFTVEGSRFLFWTYFWLHFYYASTFVNPVPLIPHSFLLEWTEN